MFYRIPLSPLSFSADHTHVCALSSSWIHDGHSAAHPAQTVEKVCILVLTGSFLYGQSHANCLLNLLVCSVVAAAPDILSPLSLILESVLQTDQQMMEKTKAKIFSALISVLQIQGLNGIKHDYFFTFVFERNVSGIHLVLWFVN